MDTSSASPFVRVLLLPHTPQPCRTHHSQTAQSPTPSSSSMSMVLSLQPVAYVPRVYQCLMLPDRLLTTPPPGRHPRNSCSPPCSPPEGSDRLRWRFQPRQATGAVRHQHRLSNLALRLLLLRERSHGIQIWSSARGAQFYQVARRGLLQEAREIHSTLHCRS